MKARFITLALALLVFLPAAAEGQVDVAEARAADLASIKAARVLGHVRDLASPALAGRQSGTQGYDRAAAWAVEKLTEAGVEPAGAGFGWLEPFPVETNKIESCRMGLPRGEEPTRWLSWGEDFVCRGFTGAARVEAPVVFVGYGISRPDLGYDDYAEVDVEGAIVLAFKGAPKWTPEGGSFADDSLPRVRAAAARAHGARGLLLVSTSEDWQTAPIGSVLHGPGEQDTTMPQLHVSMALAEELLGLEAGGLSELRASIETSKAPSSGLVGQSALLDVEATYVESAQTANIVGVLQGSDPALSREYVIIGAHLDHVGSQGAGHYFPGANDNASGVAALVAVAEALGQSEAPPKRSVAFVLFAAEESGLHGAKAFVEFESIPLSQSVAMINMDCVGYGEQLQMGGGESAPELWKLARSIDAGAERITIEKTWWGGGADAQPFFDEGLPTIYFATKDSYAHLHQPSDTADTLNGKTLAAVARHAYRLVTAIADGAYAREQIQPKAD